MILYIKQIGKREMTIIPEELQIHDPDENLLEIINNREFQDNVLFEKKSNFHTVKVVENEIGRFLHYKDTYQAGVINTRAYSGNLPYINYFTIPYLINKNVKNILLIGFGTGKLVNDLERLYSGLESFDVIDIEENILYIAETFFDYKNSSLTHFYLQDGLVYLRECKKKYDLIIVDVASDDGIDERFLSDEYFALIKKALAQDGIFVSNLCASPDFEHTENYFIRELEEIYKKHFSKTIVFKGNTSDIAYYSAFFGIKQRVIDITNVILVSMKNKDLAIDDSDLSKYSVIGLDIKPYLDDKAVQW